MVSRWGLLLVGLLCAGVVAAETRRPNIVLILSDDQAWGDYGFMGHPHVQTPHLDSLAAGGLTFDRGYVAAPICRPSLASIVTGRFPSEHGICGNDVLPKKRGAERDALDRPLQERFHQFPSIIKLLTSNGYLAHQSGKWWEGSWNEGGFTHGMKMEGRHGSRESLAIGRDGLEPVNEFVDHALAEEKPFFLWYAPFLPHTPHNPPERLLKKYAVDGRALDVAKYYAMVEWFDETCGELMATLESKGLRENTVVLYVCDNGWGARSTTTDWPWDQQFRGYAMRSKATPYENGTRTPIMVSWPGTLEPKRGDDLAHSIDLFPTIAAAAGIEVPKDLQGINLMDPEAVNARDTVFGESHASHNIEVGNPDATLQYIWCIEGDWKLLLRFHGVDKTDYRKLHTWDTAPYRLFNLNDDPGEMNDLAAAHPEIVSRLKTKIAAWRAAQ
jgi:arylsulfatase A-like enzyme